MTGRHFGTLFSDRLFAYRLEKIDTIGHILAGPWFLDVRNELVFPLIGRNIVSVETNISQLLSDTEQQITLQVAEYLIVVIARQTPKSY